MQTCKKAKIVAKIHEKLQNFPTSGKRLAYEYITKNKMRTIVRIFSVFPLLYGKLFIEIITEWRLMSERSI